MKRKNKIILGIAIGVLGLLGMRALVHAHHNPEERVAHITNKLAKKLELTDEQKTKVLEINTARMEDFKALKASGKRDKAEAKKIVQEWKSEMKEVLTEEQAKKLRI